MSPGKCRWDGTGFFSLGKISFLLESSAITQLPTSSVSHTFNRATAVDFWHLHQSFLSFRAASSQGKEPGNKLDFSKVYPLSTLGHALNHHLTAVSYWEEAGVPTQCILQCSVPGVYAVGMVRWLMGLGMERAYEFQWQGGCRCRHSISVFGYSACLLVQCRAAA